MSTTDDIDLQLSVTPTSGSRFAGQAPTPVRFKDIIVTVHGIGQQIRYSTVRYVATQLAGSQALKGTSTYRPVAPQPLGYFHSDVKAITSVVVVDDNPKLAGHLAQVGFAEVFWADIPDKIVKEGSTLEETKAWGRTVVARAQSLWDQAEGRPGIPPDFSLAAEVLDEIIETVYVLENLLFLAGKAGLFHFNLREVLEAYLGDVQIVAEFANYRKEIVLRFHQAMEHIYNQQKALGNDNVRLHVVAHSEGTVVSFLGLLQALSGVSSTTSAADTSRPASERKKAVPDWVKHLHGYMTIGSPIDKHLLLWERMWAHLDPTIAEGDVKPAQIKWRNYYDFGDPIGFKLDTAREWLQNRWRTNVFQFDGDKHDIGFARYMLPGKAHNDYWNDPEVFEHFVCDVVEERPVAVAPPKTKRWVQALSPTIPYALSFLLLFAGVFLLDKAVLAFMYPLDDAMMKQVVISRIGVEPTATISAMDVFRNTLGIAALIAGTTLLARLPRLALGRKWLGIGFGAFLIGCALYAVLITRSMQAQIGAVFGFLGGYGPTIGMCLLALAVGVFGAWIARPVKHASDDRRKRVLLRGTRPLIASGAAAIALIVATQLFPGIFQLDANVAPYLAQLTPEQRAIIDKDPRIVAAIRKAGLDDPELKQLFSPDNAANLANVIDVQPLLSARPALWPVLLAGGLFLYLWWLATLVFDLAFVWHRYIRRNVAHDRLVEWSKHKQR